MFRFATWTLATTLIAGLMMPTVFSQANVADRPGHAIANGGGFSPTVGSPTANLFSGSAGTSIEIKVPPGRMTMTPKLVLNYSSSAGESAWGYGWSLSTGKITRSTKRGLPKYSNDPVSGDTFVLELDGGVMELKKNSDGGYTAKIESAFFKAGFDEEKNYWRVMDRNGTAYHFGQYSQARKSRQGPNVNDSEQTFAWYLDHAVDVHGNTMDYYYVGQTAEEETRPGLPLRISYGASTVKKVNVAHHLFHVEFDWEDLGPRAMSYAKGFYERTEPRHLNAIRTYVDLERDGQGTLAREYITSYVESPGAGVKLLRSIQERGVSVDGGQALTVGMPETVFDYAPDAPFEVDAAIGFDLTAAPDDEFTSPGPFQDFGQDLNIDVFDINGDSLPDYVKSPGAIGGGALGEVRLGSIVDDVDGDGEKDFRFGDPRTWSWPGSLPRIRHVNDHADVTTQIFDIDGDRVPDLVYSQSTAHWLIYRGNCYQGGSCTGFDTQGIPWDPAPHKNITSNNSYQGSSDFQASRTTLDFTGDGSPDYVIVNGHAGTWTIEPNLWNPDRPEQSTFGFGTDDLDTISVNIPSYRSSSAWTSPSGYPAGLFESRHAALSQGVNFSDQRHISDDGYEYNYLISQLIDMTGDGLPDLVVAPDWTLEYVGSFDNRKARVITENYWRVYPNVGGTFRQTPIYWRVEGEPVIEVGQTVQKDFPLEGPCGYGQNCSDWVARDFLFNPAGIGEPSVTHGNSDFSQTIARLIDINNDGYTDYIRRADPFEQNDNSEYVVYLNNGQGFQAPRPYRGALPDWVGRTRLEYYSDHANPANDSKEYKLIDLNKDGAPDLVIREGQGSAQKWKVYYYDKSQGQGLDAAPNALVSMMNGLGGVTALNYQPASYVGGAACGTTGSREDEYCLGSPMWVVKSITTLDATDALGTSEPTTTEYDYRGAYYDAVSREFRGFRKVWEIHPDRTSTLHEFHQGPACRGLEENTIEYGNPGNHCAELKLDNESHSCSPAQRLKKKITRNFACPLVESGDLPLLLRNEITRRYKRAGGQVVELTPLWQEISYNYDEEYGVEETKLVSSPSVGTVVYETQYDKQIFRKKSGGWPKDYVVNRPSRVLTYLQGQQDQPLHEQTFAYTPKWELKAKVDCQSWSQGGECDVESKTKYKSYIGGYATKVFNPLKGRTDKLLDKYALYTAWASNPAGNTVNREYDYRNGKVIRYRDPSGQVHRTVYDGLDRVSRAWGPHQLSNIWENGPISFQGNELKGEVWYDYTEPELVADENENVSVIQQGLVKKTMIGSMQAPEVSFYDGFARSLGSKTFVKRAGGVKDTMVGGLRKFNAHGKLSEAAMTVAVDGDELSLLETTSDASDAVLRIEYDQYTGFKNKETLPNGKEIRYNLNSPGVKAVKEPGDLVKIEVMDGFGRKVSDLQCYQSGLMPSAALANATPTGTGRELADAYAAFCHDLKARTDYAYDGLDRLTDSWIYNLEDPGSDPIHSLHIEYDGLGNKTSVMEVNVGASGSGTWQYEHNAAGAVTEVVRPDGSIVRYEYNKTGRLKRERSFSHDGARQPTLVTTYTYVTGNDIEKGEDGDSGSGGFSGSRGVGKIYSVTSTGGGSSVKRTYGYNDRGHVANEKVFISVTKPSGEVVSKEFDFSYGYGSTDPDKLSAINYPKPGGGTQLYTVEYDAEFGLAERASIGGTQILKRAQYDRDGNLTYMRYGNDLRDHYRYSDKNEHANLRCIRTTRATDNAQYLGLDASASCPKDNAKDLFNINIKGRDSSGRITEIGDQRYGNSAAYTAYRKYAYDRVGRLTNVDYRSNATSAYKQGFSYDSLGRMVTRDSWVNRYDVNKPHQLISIDSETNVNGNGLTFPVAHDDNGNRTGVNQASYRYDHYDRMIENLEGGQAKARHYYGQGQQRVARYDYATGELTFYFNGLVELTGNKITRHFMANGRRIASDSFTGDLPILTATAPLAPKTAWKIDIQFSPEQFAWLWIAIVSFFALVFIVRGPRMHFGRRVALVTVAAYMFAFIVPLPKMFAAGQGVAHAQQSADPSMVYYHVDHVGSPVLLTDRNGDVVEHIRYDAFGAVRGRYNPNFSVKNDATTNAGFTGHLQEPGSNLIYANARFYDPGLGMFLQMDPAREGRNPYAYVGFDPVNKVDPDGEEGITLLAAMLIAALASAVISFALTLIETGNVKASLKSAVHGFVSGWMSMGVGAALTAPGGTVGAAAAAKLIDGVQTVHGLYNMTLGLREGRFSSIFSAVRMAYGYAKKFGSGDGSGNGGGADGDGSGGGQDTNNNGGGQTVNNNGGGAGGNGASTTTRPGSSNAPWRSRRATHAKVAQSVSSWSGQFKSIALAKKDAISDSLKATIAFLNPGAGGHGVGPSQVARADHGVTPQSPVREMPSTVHTFDGQVLNINSGAQIVTPVLQGPGGLQATHNQ